MSQRSYYHLLHRLRVFPIALAFLVLLSIACGGKGQEIREMAADRLDGVADSLSDKATVPEELTPTPEIQSERSVFHSRPPGELTEEERRQQEKRLEEELRRKEEERRHREFIYCVKPIEGDPGCPVPTEMPKPRPTSQSVKQAESPVLGSQGDQTSSDVPTVEPTPTPVSTATPLPTATPVPSPTPPPVPTATAAPTTAGSQGIDGTKIAFSSERDGNREIYVMNADGSNQTRLTNYPGRDSSPALSPDGTKIAFTSDRDGNQEIFVMNADGSGQTRLTDSSGIAQTGNPSWSPDGTRVAFTSGEAYNEGDIHVINADGSGGTNLTNHPSMYLQRPSWSPDGKKIAFTRAETPGYDAEIYIMDANGGNQERLTNISGDDGFPSWSPDGTKIAFGSNRDGASYDIFVMNADGSNQTNITKLTYEPSDQPYADFDLDPSWSPDGKKITFITTRNGGVENIEIYVMNADGSGQTRLTDSLGDDSEASWGPEAGS